MLTWVYSLKGKQCDKVKRLEYDSKIRELKFLQNAIYEESKKYENRKFVTTPIWKL